MWMVLLVACTDQVAEDSGEPLSPEAEAFVAAHNAVREPLGLSPLSWDSTATASSLGWAETLAADCSFAHESQQVYGENLWWSTFTPTPKEVVDAWASEVAYYDYASNTCQDGQMCGHYTQIVWADTTTVGCAMSRCADESVIWACRYSPPGNWIGEWPY